MIDSFDVRRILLWLRATAIAGQLLTLLAAMWFFGDTLPYTALFGVPLLYGLWHLGLIARLRAHDAAGGGELPQNLLTLEIAVDLLAVSALLFLAGGWTNPFTPVLLVPLAFAAAALAWQRAVVLTLLAFASYAALVKWHLRLPTVHERFGGDFNLHMLGMWASFVAAAIVLVGAVAMVRAALERERRALARLREARLRDEQLVAIGALAASAAHELGTPLATARLIAEELEHAADDEVSAQAAVLARQLDAASDSLRLLVRGALDEPGGGARTLPNFVDQLLARFAVLRPEVDVHRAGLPLPAFELDDTRLLESGVLGILMNAADAPLADTAGASARVRIDVEHEVRDEALHLRIRDYGAGMPTHATRLGSAPVASRGGMGVGWVISSATFERHGGRASYAPAHPGTCVHVRLPLHALRGGAATGLGAGGDATRPGGTGA